MRHPVQIPIRLSVLVHTKVVSHLVGDDEHRLKVVSLVDRARVVGVAHSGDPGQPNHTGKVFFYHLNLLFPLIRILYLVPLLATLLSANGLFTI